LISANIAGVFLSLRVEMPTERVEGIRMGPPRLPLELARAKLLWSKTDTPESYATRANQTIHDSMINGDVTTDLSRWRLEIPVWENWVLHGLGVIEPKLRSYRFWDYHKEFERGIGLCGHLSTILVGYLEANGVPARMVGLSGHMIVTAEVAPGVWYLFDPDYGVVIPHALEVVENSQELIEAAYAAEDDATLRAIINYYASKTDNSVDSTGRGGFYTSWGDTAEEYSVRENLANILKWVVPVSLVLFGACILVLTFLGGRRQRRRPRGVVPQG
jgi:hypothetical protein